MAESKSKSEVELADSTATNADTLRLELRKLLTKILNDAGDKDHGETEYSVGILKAIDEAIRILTCLRELESKKLESVSATSSLAPEKTATNADTLRLELQKLLTKILNDAGDKDHGETEYSVGILKAIDEAIRILTCLRELELKKSESVSDEEAPDEITKEETYKRMCIEEKRIRESRPSNPFRCPDLSDKHNWSKKDNIDYMNWLSYKRGYVGLTRKEEDIMTSMMLHYPGFKKTDI